MGIPACNGTTGGQLNAVQNVNIPCTDMNGAAFPACGFIGPDRMFYDPYPPKFLMEDGQWVLNDSTTPPVPVRDPSDRAPGDYYLDPRQRDIPLDQGGGFHPRFVYQIGRAHVCTPVTNSPLVCQPLLDKKKSEL